MVLDASTKNLVSDICASVFGSSKPTLVLYAAALCKQSSNPSDIAEKLLELGMYPPNQIHDFAHKLFNKLPHRTPSINLYEKEEKELIELANKQITYSLISDDVYGESEFCSETNKRKIKCSSDAIISLKKKSRREYLKKREKNKLEELRDELEDDKNFYKKKIECSSDDIIRLRKKSRQKYSKKREEKKLEVLRDELEDDRYFLLDNETKCKRDVYEIVKKRGHNDYLNEYRIPESYDQDGHIDQRKRFSVALLPETYGIEKEKSWEECQTHKAMLTFGSEKEEREADRYQLVFDHMYVLEEQLPACSVGDKEGLVSQATENIQDGRKALPIYHFREKLLEAIKSHQILVIVGETGSGKTTQLPQYLHEAGYTKKGKIGCTQPRRVAAMSVASRVAKEMGTKLGHYVGYSVRFEDCTSKKTVLKYMTDGMLLREFVVEPDLRSYSVIIVDEAHERTISTDILFGLLKDLAILRSDLKLLITSATLEAQRFSNYFDSAPIFEIPGRQHPVDILYKKPEKSCYVQEAVAAVLRVHATQPPGDILVFLTGQEEIENAEDTLNEKMRQYGSKLGELIICTLFANLPMELQARTFDPTPRGARKVVLATNIAETSLTIDGIRYVIDSGYCKMDFYMPGTDMESLQVIQISKASAMQRAGRAGRTAPGKCIRLYTSDQYKEFKDNYIPEIQRSNIANAVLTMKALGIDDIMNFDFMDTPSAEYLLKAFQLLYDLGALNSQLKLMEIGTLMEMFPLDPKLSKSLIASERYGCSEEMMTITAMLSVGNAIFYRPKKKQVLADNAKRRFHIGNVGDHIALLRAYDSWKETNFSAQWCYENFIQVKSMKRARDIRDQLEGLMGRAGIELKSNPDDYTAIQKSILSGLFPHMASLQQQCLGCYKTLKNPQIVHLHPDSGLANLLPRPKWVVYHELVLTAKEYMRQVTEIRPEWLMEIAPDYYHGANTGI